MSSNNELAALRAAMESWDSDQTQEALRFLNTEFGTKIQDERYRAELDTAAPVDRRTHPELYIRDGAFLEMRAEMVVICRDMVFPAVAILRRQRGDALFIGFEYLADRDRLWTERNPRGSLPKN